MINLSKTITFDAKFTFAERHDRYGLFKLDDREEPLGRVVLVFCGEVLDVEELVLERKLGDITADALEEDELGEDGLVAEADVVLGLLRERALEVGDPVQVDHAPEDPGDRAGRADEATLEELRVELGDADAESIALRRTLNGLLEHLHRLHFPGLSDRRDFHSLGKKLYDIAEKNA